MKIEILYPEIANLFGDLANIKYIKSSIPDCKVIGTDLSTKPRFLTEKDVVQKVNGIVRVNLTVTVKVALANYGIQRIAKQSIVHQKHCIGRGQNLITVKITLHCDNNISVIKVLDSIGKSVVTRLNIDCVPITFAACIINITQCKTIGKSTRHNHR
jgi:hypothetical protein